VPHNSQNFTENMKTPRSAKAGNTIAASPVSQRRKRTRPAIARTVETHIDWRKIREQLRRRDWPLNTYG
jgi:hypothetical protein